MKQKGAVAAVWNFVDAVNNNTFVGAIRRGLTLMIPFMITGAFALFLNNLPIAAYQQAMERSFGESWKSFGEHIFDATFGILSVCLTISIGYTLTESRKERHLEVHPMIGGLLSLICLFVLIGNGGSLLDWIGPLGVFMAIITAIAATTLHLALCRLRMFRIRLQSNTAESYFHMALVSLLPAILTVLVFAGIRALLILFGVKDIHAALYESLSGLFANLSSPLSSGFLYAGLTHIMWFFGLHGNNVLEPVAHSILLPAMETNAQMAAEGLIPTEIFTKQFFDVFVLLGGSGATLCLIIALFIGARRRGTRKIASISVLPALINVNEIMIFGMPMVLNFFLLIPFITVPLVLASITYLAMLWGVVSMTTVAVEWTTPIFVGGYVATGGSVSGIILQLFNLIVGTLMYLPFIRMYEKSLDRDNGRILNNLMSEVENLPELRKTVLLNRRDSAGNMARALAEDLLGTIGSNELCLHYQPLTMRDGSLFGVEALLRWNHKQFGYIPPPVAIAVAEESGRIGELGLFIFEEAIKALRVFKSHGNDDFVMSVNITPSQLDDPSFAESIMAITQKHGQNPQNIDIEITEQTALGGITRIETLNRLKDFGFNISMDDFGMGHGSLTYLKDIALDVIKIDGAIVRELETNESCRGIIETIVSLCKSRDIHIIAEYVETERQREILSDLGCHCYQGWLYSRALPFDMALEYVKSEAGL